MKREIINKKNKLGDRTKLLKSLESWPFPPFVAGLLCRTHVSWRRSGLRSRISERRQRAENFGVGYGSGQTHRLDWRRQHRLQRPSQSSFQFATVQRPREYVQLKWHGARKVTPKYWTKKKWTLKFIPFDAKQFCKSKWTILKIRRLEYSFSNNSFSSRW